MAEHINKYETIFVIDATKTEEEITALVEKFKSLIEKNGEIESVDEWGKRRLAYAINDLTEGYYVLVNFKFSPGNSSLSFYKTPFLHYQLSTIITT